MDDGRSMGLAKDPLPLPMEKLRTQQALVERAQFKELLSLPFWNGVGKRRDDQLARGPHLTRGSGRLRKNYCGGMLKKFVQQGRSERGGEAYASVR